MRPEEKLHRAIWDALDDLAQQKLAVPSDEWILIDCRTPERKRAIAALKSCGAIKVIKTRKPSPPFGMTVLYEMQNPDVEPIGYYVDTIEPRFTEVVDAYYEVVGRHSTISPSRDVLTKLGEKLKGWRNELPVTVTPASPVLPAVEQHQKKPEQKIEKLTFVQPEKNESKLTIIVNDDYQHSCHFDAKKPSGALLTKIMQGEQSIPYADYKDPFDYLNGEKNQLVTKTGCIKTKMLTSEVGYITPTVEIEVIREKAFTQRRGKALKNA